MISGVPAIVDLGTRMLDPYVYVAFGPSLVSCAALREEELKLNCHQPESMLFTIYQYYVTLS